MNIAVLIGRTILKNPHITENELAKEIHLSLDKTNEQLKNMQNNGLITIKEDNGYFLTDAGMNFMQKYKVDNAIITAAGFGSRFVPLSYEMPKGLLEVLGERMVERQIKQLHDAGITDITIVVGYLKEKFEYLIDKYNVKLIYNPEYSSKNSLSTLYHVRHLLKNTYILASDNWLRDNIYNEYEPAAWYSGAYMQGDTSEWCLITDKDNLVTDVQIGGADSYVMYGPAYFDREFSEKYRAYVEEYYDTPGTENFYWEQIVKDKLHDLKFYCNCRPDNTVYEFENLEELRLFDTKYQNNSGNAALEYIARVFEVSENEITCIKCLKSNAGDKSFLFNVKGESYIFNDSGTTTDPSINKAEKNN
ncbi:MAG: winged helix-turn-helix transcriptional regulator [Lachnospiraceae bacterium]|nr:winged helix-turn-helix transcriptional regulator [Lachnospiraceae bacterium]